MIDFARKFFVDGFVSGDYLYGFIHIFSILLLLIIIFLLSKLFKNKDEQYIRDKLKIISLVCLTIYLLRRAINAYYSGNVIEEFWPFYLCNINTIFVCLYLIFEFKKGEEFFLITGLLGGIITFILADGIFTDKYLTYGILDSITSHYIIIIAPVILLRSKYLVLTKKSLIIIFLGLLLTVFNAEVLQVLLFKKNFDYLFLRSDVPFTIPHIPQFFIISSLTIIFVLIIYFLDMLYINKTKNVPKN